MYNVSKYNYVYTLYVAICIVYILKNNVYLYLNCIIYYKS